MRRLPFVLGLLLSSISFASTAAAQECFPTCRSGFACVKGACVSACNPPCGSGSRCENGDCTPAQAAPPPVAQPAAQPAARAPVTSAPPTAASGPASVAAPETSSSGALLHNGFYLRLALGLGYARLSSSFEGGGKSGEGTATGASVGTSFLLGGTIVPGLVLGGGVESTVIPKLTSDGPYSSNATISTAVYGPFVDWYFDPRRGLHASLMLGLGTAGPTDGDGDIETGLGVVGAVGHDWFVSDQWSVGVAGRLQYFRQTEETTGYDARTFQTFPITNTNTFVIPSVLCTFTYH